MAQDNCTVSPHSVGVYEEEADFERADSSEDITAEKIPNTKSR